MKVLLIEKRAWPIYRIGKTIRYWFAASYFSSLDTSSLAAIPVKVER